MILTTTELITLAGSLLLQMTSPHLPKDCDHYKELNELYIKLTKEMRYAKNNNKED